MRVWKNYMSSHNLEMVTSWTALNNLVPMSNSEQWKTFWLPSLQLFTDETLIYSLN